MQSPVNVPYKHFTFMHVAALEEEIRLLKNILARSRPIEQPSEHPCFAVKSILVTSAEKLKKNQLRLSGKKRKRQITHSI